MPRCERRTDVGPARHAAADMPTAPGLLPTPSRFECRIAEVRPMSGRRRHTAAEMPTSFRCIPTSGRPRHVYWVVVPGLAPRDPVPANISLKSTLHRPTKKTDPPETRLVAAQETRKKTTPTDVNVYTGCSAARGRGNGPFSKIRCNCSLSFPTLLRSRAGRSLFPLADSPSCRSGRSRLFSTPLVALPYPGHVYDFG